jgi:hypothetical protein
VQGEYGKCLLRRRGEFVERSLPPQQAMTACRWPRFCSLLRDRRNVTLHRVWTGQYSEASARSLRRVQHQPGAA